MTNSFQIALVILISLAGKLFAQGVTESNYLHIDSRSSLYIPRVFTAKNSSKRILYFNGMRLGSKLNFNNNTLSLGTGKQKNASFVLFFDEDVCAIGVQVKFDNGGVRNSVQVTFDFFNSFGEKIDQEIRFPAGGTTRQSFTSDDFSSRFQAVVVTASWASNLAIREIKAVTCAFNVSQRFVLPIQMSPVPFFPHLMREMRDRGKKG